MSYKQRESNSITKATQRLNGLRAIDPTGKLDLGNGFGIETFQAEILTATQHLTVYNEALKAVVGLKNEVDAAEKRLNKFSSGVLTAVGQKFTKNSTQYEQAGGVRESERLKRMTKPRTTPKPAAS
ncbi:hypothetical protein [Hymenobacter chitinivorans]|uniref:Excreted virulence factor EspC (Type VII ESX diderm) n=1 Tax=Hymenobacter chitinivorans DSM 11115 TaxID=1121954 RepID=A0A2M9BR69_9BACT|nr:hypothetical protein [Hymenobacter chitinivorans]PJJ60456.1 hypothetical protein CLV45_1883 [Hymenobacter chitinivorans DSM 11115]